MSVVLRLQKKCLDKEEDLQSLLREAHLIVFRGQYTKLTICSNK